MPGRRCVVQGCSNTPDKDRGISVHISPKNKSEHDKWVRFVRTHRAKFKPEGRFMVCSDHFDEQCFERCLHVEGSRRVLRPSSVPSIWMKETAQKPSSSRSVRRRKKVVQNLLSFDENDTSSLDEQELHAEDASGNTEDKECPDLLNPTPNSDNSTPVMSGPESFSSAVSGYINDSTEIEDASGSFIAFFPMLTSTPSMNVGSEQIPSSNSCEESSHLMDTQTKVSDVQSITSDSFACAECTNLKKERKKLKRKTKT